MVPLDSPRMGRPPKTSRAEIIEAAARFNAEELQLSTLALQLGVSVRTLYAYFPSRRALVDALRLRELATRGVPEVQTCATWQEVLTAAAKWFYEIGADYVPFSAATTGPRAVVLEAARVVQQRLEELRWEPRNALSALTSVCNWALGMSIAARNTIDAGGLGPANVRSILSDYLEEGAAQQLTELMSSFTLEEGFADGLRIQLVGIEKTLAPRR